MGKNQCADDESGSVVDGTSVVLASCAPFRPYCAFIPLEEPRIAKIHPGHALGDSIISTLSKSFFEYRLCSVLLMGDHALSMEPQSHVGRPLKLIRSSGSVRPRPQ